MHERKPDYVDAMYRTFLSCSGGRKKGESEEEYWMKYAQWLSDADLEAHHRFLQIGKDGLDPRFISIIENEFIERTIFRGE